MINGIEVLKDLIRIDTTVPPGKNYRKVIEYLSPLFSEVGLQTEIIEIPKERADDLEGRFNLIAHKREPGKPRLIFYSHIDVVPADKDWKPFVPRLKEGKIFGRGAADMKGSIVGLLLGLEKVKEKELKYDLSVTVTTDEEIGQASQLEYLAQFLEPLEGAYFFSLDSDAGFVGKACLGAIHLEINVIGKSCHSAVSHRGINAIEGAIRLGNALLKLKKKVISRKSEIDLSPDSEIKKMEGRLNINVIQGGLKVNIVPDQCLISVDRRVIPEEDLTKVEEELMGALKSVRGVQWEVSKIIKIPGFSVEHPFLDELARIIKEVTGTSGKYGIMGSGDLPSLALKWGAIPFGFGVARGDSNIHGREESVNLQDVYNLGEIIARLLI